MRRTPADDDLLIDAADGDDAAFAAFFVRHQTAVFGLFLRRTRNRQRSRELTAETFATALRRAPCFDADDQSAMSWLLAIAGQKLDDEARASVVS